MAIKCRCDMDWNECKNKRLVKEINPDKWLILSLMKGSKNKLISFDMLNLNFVTVASKVSLTYDSLRELLEALAIKKGYKIYNHDCYCSFLKEIVKDFPSGEIFDEFRKIRNGLNYYGKDLSLEEIIKQMKLMINKIKHIID